MVLGNSFVIIVARTVNGNMQFEFGLQNFHQSLVLWSCWPPRTPETPKIKSSSKVTFRVSPKVTPFRKYPRKWLFDPKSDSKRLSSGQTVTFRVTFRVALGETPNFTSQSLMSYFQFLRGFGGSRSSAVSQVLCWEAVGLGTLKTVTSLN